MEQNNFEKNVQQKLGGLEIQPSESVWVNVEKRIEKKNERSWKLIILFFLSLVILSAGGYWILNSLKTNKPQSEKIDNNLQKSIGLPTQKKSDSSLNQTLISDKNDTNTIAFKNPKISTNLNSAIAKNENSDKPKSRNSLFIKEANSQSKMQSSVGSERENVKNIQNGLPGKKENLVNNENGKINTDIEKPEQEKAANDSLTHLAKVEKKKQQTDTTNLVVNSKKQVQTNLNQKRKWRLGITISGGTSLVGSNPFGINNNYAPQPLTSNIGTPSSYSQTSKAINSFAFIGGVFIEKNISSKNKITIGINYKYFSTLNKIGKSIDTSQTPYYSANAVNNYRNNFNYLELPISLKFRLGNNKSLPIYWEAGISISQLISSNALQYKQGLYYTDNSLLNKTQLGFSTGFSATLFSKQKNPISIGPNFYYSASNLADEGLYNKRHFSFIGISTEILFGKK